MSSMTYEEWITEAHEYFSKWDKAFYLWKSFRYPQKNLLKSYVGLVIFGIPNECQGKDDVPRLESVWHYFTEDQRQTITEITDKFKFENQYVIIGHTYLYLDNQSTVCVLRQMRFNNEITFIDCFGRVYNSWSDFCNTNRLPSCKYVAPDDGLHKVKQQLRVYKSPAASPGHQLQQATDVVVGSCSMVAVGLTAIALAPVTAMVLGTVGTVYGVARSIDVLKDRSNHEQPIGLNNPESIVAWSGIVTAALAGASSVALARSAQIVEASGNYGNFARAALKGMNYAAMTSCICNFGTYAYAMRLKMVNGEELTSFDYLELAVNLFLVVGCVANTRQMNKYINSLETAPTGTTARLTRTAKRKLQRLRAKLRKNGGNSGNSNAISANVDVKEVTILEEDIPAVGLNMIVTAGQQFINRHINIQSIYMKCLEIWDTCKDFQCEKISLVVFASNMINHVQNLFILMSETLLSIKSKAESFLKQYFYHISAPPSLTEQIGHMIENTTSAVKKVNEGLQEEDEQQPTENEPKLKYEIILEAAKNRIPTTTQTGQVISEFNKQLSSLIDEIITESNNSYEEFVSKNIQMLGKIQAEEIFSNLGIKTLNDFANINFQKIMESKISNQESIRSSVNDGIIQHVLSAYKRLLAKVEPQNILSELGALGTCDLLKQSVTEFFNPFGERFNTANELYDINVSFLGHSTAMKIVFNALKGIPRLPNTINNMTLFDLAAETLNFDKIAEVLSVTISNEKQTNKVSSQLDDENVHTTVLLLCDKFYRKVESRMNIIGDAEREKRIKDCYRYLMENFTAFIEAKKKEQNVEISQCSSKLQNLPFLNQQSFIQYYRKVSECKNQQMFASAVEHFTAENNLANLAAKYTDTCKVANNFYVPVCDEISQAEDGMRIYSINEGTYPNLQIYKSTAAKVFGLNEYNMKILKWEKGAVILECGCNKKVIFQNVDTKSMILMEVDTSKEPSSR